MSSNKTALSEQVADQLLNIIESEYCEGDKIPNEMELADRLEVSRTTIREAIKSLSAMNVVEIRRGKGTFVCGSPGLLKDPLGYRFLEKKKATKDLLEMSLIFEPEIAALATQKATAEDIEKLKDVLNEIHLQLEEFEKGNVGIIQLIQIEMKFHEYVADCCSNNMIARIVPIINEGLKELYYMNAPLITQFLGKYHKDIIEAIAHKDPGKARKFMRMHLLAIQQPFA